MSASGLSSLNRSEILRGTFDFLGCLSAFPLAIPLVFSVPSLPSCSSLLALGRVCRSLRYTHYLLWILHDSDTFTCLSSLNGNLQQKKPLPLHAWTGLGIGHTRMDGIGKSGMAGWNAGRHHTNWATQNTKLHR